MLPSAQFTFDMCAGAYVCLKTQKNHQGSTVLCTGYGWTRD